MLLNLINQIKIVSIIGLSYYMACSTLFAMEHLSIGNYASDSIWLGHNCEQNGKYIANLLNNAISTNFECSPEEGQLKLLIKNVIPGKTYIFWGEEISTIFSTPVSARLKYVKNAFKELNNDCFKANIFRFPVRKSDYGELVKYRIKVHVPSNCAI